MKTSERNVASVRTILCVCERETEEGKGALLKNTNLRSNSPEPTSVCEKF